MPVEDEIKLLEKTVVCRDLSTSLSSETEDEELKMLRNMKPLWLWGMKTLTPTPTYSNSKMSHHCQLQGLSITFACLRSGDPVRVLCLYTMNTLDTL